MASLGSRRDRHIPPVLARDRDQTGQALAEFSLTAAIVLLLFLTVVDFGRMVAMHTAAVTASREAARYGSTVGLVGAVERYRNCDGIRDAARKVTASLITLTDGDIAVSYDDGPATATHSTCPNTAGADTIAAGSVTSLDRVVVQITFTYRPITPIALLVPPITVVSTDRRTIVLSP
jgi:Flp pilus assembly protein TadG